MKISMPFLLHPYVAAAISGAGAILSSWLLRHFELNAPLRLAAALLAVPPSAFLIYAMLRWVRSLDEMQQRIQTEALALAFSASLLVALAIGQLQKASYFTALDWGDAWEILGGLYILGYWIAHRRYT